MSFFVKSEIETMRDAGDVDGLIAALTNDDNYTVRTEAARALGIIHDTRALEPLIKALNDSYGNVIEAAAEALGEIGHPDAVGPLSSTAKKNRRNWGICVSAVEAMGKIGSANAVQAIVSHYQWAKAHELDEDNQLSVTAAQLGSTATESLSMINDPFAVKPLASVLKKNNQFLRGAAVQALGKIGEPAVESLIDALNEKDQQVRQAAAEALGITGSPHAVEPLSYLLADKDKKVRESVIKALGKIGGLHAAKALESVEKDKSWFIRRAAARELKNINLKPKILYCSNCGFKLAGIESYCPECGNNCR